jgi:hypothetical protein
MRVGLMFRSHWLLHTNTFNLTTRIFGNSLSTLL